MEDITLDLEAIPEVPATPTTLLEDFSRAIRSRIAALEAVVSDQFEVAVVFPLQLGTSQSMRVHTIRPVAPDMLAFNGLLDNHTPASVIMQITHIELALITRKRFESSQKAMTAYGFKQEGENDWS